MPDSHSALIAAADLDLAALGLGGEARDLGGAGTPERDLAAGRALGKRAEREALKGGLPDAQGAGVEAGVGGAGAGALQRLERDALQERRLLTQLGPGLGDVPLGLRAELREGRQDLGADPVAGKSRIEVRLVVGEGQARRLRPAPGSLRAKGRAAGG